jgi:hypothetical protein
MFHPLAPDLSGLTDNELHEKHNELVSKINQAYRFGPSSAIPQMHMIQGHFLEEIQRRNQKQLEDMQKHNKDFKKIIDIK